MGFCVGCHCTEGCQADLGPRTSTAKALVGEGEGEAEGEAEGEGEGEGEVAIWWVSR